MLLVAAGCHLRYPPLRSEYRLHRSDDFILSNIYVHPLQIQEVKDHLKIDYSLLVKNMKEIQREVNLKGASIRIGLRNVPITCIRFQTEEVAFTMRPLETISIKCDITIHKGEGMFQIKDYKALIEIPLEKEKALFTYLLRAEDFQ